MHLPKKLRISTLAYTTTPERIKLEIKRQDIFCKKYYPLIRREVADNIAAPLVKPFSTDLAPVISEMGFTTEHMPYLAYEINLRVRAEHVSFSDKIRNE